MMQLTEWRCVGIVLKEYTKFFNQQLKRKKRVCRFLDLSVQVHPYEAECSVGDAFNQVYLDREEATPRLGGPFVSIDQADSDRALFLGDEIDSCQARMESNFVRDSSKPDPIMTDAGINEDKWLPGGSGPHKRGFSICTLEID